MTLVILLLLLLAAICFGVAAFARSNPAPRVNLVAVGLLLWVLTELLSVGSTLNID